MGVLFWRRVSRLGMSASWPPVPAGAQLHRAARRAGPARPEAAAHPRGHPQRHLLAPAGRAPRPTAFGPADSDPDAGLVRQVRHHVLRHRRRDDQPRLQPGRERRLPGRGEPALPALLLREAAVLHGRDGQLRAGRCGRRRRDADGGPHAADRRPGLGHEDDGHRRTRGLRDPRRRRRGARPASSTARRTRSSGDRRTSTSPARQYSLGRSSYVGGILTDTEFASGHNRVGGADVSLRFGQHVDERHLPGHGDAPARRPREQRRPRRAGPLRLRQQADPVHHPDGALRPRLPDGHRVPEPGGHHAGLDASWPRASIRTPRSIPWFKRIVPFVFTHYGHDRIQGGKPWIVVPGVRMHFTRQGFFRVDGLFGRGAVGRADLPQAQRPRSWARRSSRAGSTSYAQHDHRPLDLLRPGRSLPRRPRAATTPRWACSRARASTRR